MMYRSGTTCKLVSLTLISYRLCLTDSMLGTQEVGIYKCCWSSSVDIYLVDTPGFDDTTRSDTDVLKETVTFFTSSYKKNIKLSGIIYLHRISDPRVGGSARKNLFMFRKLCGREALKNVLLVTTMWENEKLSICENREQELTETEDFWGVLVESGARVERHDNSRDSAMRLLKSLVDKPQMIMSIQKEMVNERKTLDQTQAGIELEAELRKQREKFKKELAEAQEMMKEAIEASDQKSAEMIRQHKLEMERKIDRVLRERDELRVDMERMHAEKFAELERKHQEQQAQLREKEKMAKRELKNQEKHDREMRNELESLRQQLDQRQEEQKSLTEPRRLLMQALSIIPQLGSLSQLSLDRHRPSGVQVRTRSITGPIADRQEPVFLSLFDSNSSFVGPKSVYLHKLRRNPTYPVNDVNCEYLALGTNLSLYMHNHGDDFCRTSVSVDLIVEYPDLWYSPSWYSENLGMKDLAVGCLRPSHLSLGNNGCFYARNNTGQWSYSLPKTILDQAGDFEHVRRLWLGANDAYIIEKDDSSWVWNLYGQYQGLSDCIQTYDVIEGIGMNPTNPLNYIIISSKDSYSLSGFDREAGILKFIRDNF
ncbi:hypothetical protein BGZ63DRAFT_396743 [Mariannaea sp. PMI_226]|nr:hypothetical protein BGZ63DRAFT_396743 [Mariannaea sp. PMI_226]